MPVEKSLASRIPKQNKGSFTGSLVDPHTNRIIVYESKLERGLAYILRANPRVSRIWDQPDAVTYVDDHGKVRQHTFDFLAILHCGRRIAYAVKPRAKVERSGILRIIELIRQQVGGRFADAYVLRTDQDITSTRVSNAQLIVTSQAERNDDHVNRVRQITASIIGVARIADVVAKSELHGHALRAIACLIGEGVIRLAHPGLINHGAYIAPASPAAR